MLKCGKLFFDEKIVKDQSLLEAALGEVPINYSDADMENIWQRISDAANEVGFRLGLYTYTFGEKWQDAPKVTLEDNGNAYIIGFDKAGEVYSIVMKNVFYNDDDCVSTELCEKSLDDAPTEDEILAFIRES